MSDHLVSFASWIRRSDRFAGNPDLPTSCTFRETKIGDVLTSKRNRDPLPILALGRVSPRRLSVTPNGDFRPQFAKDTADETIGATRISFSVGNLHPEDKPIFDGLFTASFEGLERIQHLFPEHPRPQFMLETEDLQKIRITKKAFELVSIALLLFFCSYNESFLSQPRVGVTGVFTLTSFADLIDTLHQLSIPPTGHCHQTSVPSYCNPELLGRSTRCL
jgi:hypothetical protein